jgi:hypothetical protein
MSKRTLNAIVLILAMVIGSQEGRAQVTDSQPYKPYGEFTALSLDALETGRLTPGYKGISIEYIVNVVEKLATVKKDQFERTVDFNARKSWMRTTYLGDLSLDDQLVFVVPVESREMGNAFYYNYDADSGEVSIFASPRTSSPNGIGGPIDAQQGMRPRNLKVLYLKYTVEPDRSYLGMNMFGATAEVSETRSTNLGFASESIQFPNFETRYGTSSQPVARFALEVGRAVKEVRSIKAAIIAKLTDPYILYDWDSSDATIDSPMKYIRQDKLLFGNIMGIVFFSEATGEIFAKIPNSLRTKEARSDIAH